MGLWYWYVCISTSAIPLDATSPPGAGFYLDATSEKWSKHYRMHTFISEELPSVLKTATHIPLVRPLMLSS